ncbi:MAG TPA: LTA synthase family protein, partial [Bacilli bacterium]
LKQNGYAAYAFHPYEKTFWNRQAMYRNFGFDKFYGKGDFKPAEIVGWDIGDEYFFTQSVDMLKQARQPFYAFLVALSSHHPYSNIPRSYHTLPLGPYADTLFGNYLTAVHYVDYAIGTLVDKLKKEGLWDNTVLIFYGDHDGYLNMDKKMADFIGVSFDALTQDQILRQTPLYIHIPGSRETGESRQTVGMIDIAPSVLQLLGIDASQYDMMGRTITDHADHRIVFRSGGFSDGKLYFVASPDGDVNKGVCYNLASRQRVGLPLCRDGADMAMQELSFSDKIITNDLLRDFRKQEQEQEEKIP